MDFADFFKECNTDLKYYYAGVIYEHYNISENLQSNIHDFNEFKRFFHIFNNSKLRIRCNENLDQSIVFNNYILPSAIFLYYMHVDIFSLCEIDLYLVESERYSFYRTNVGGEYASGQRKISKENVHIIFIRYFKENTLSKQLESMCTLFHELTHLIDNKDLKEFTGAHEIDYRHRWHEIKAKYISEFFIPFYMELKHTFSSISKTFLIESINDIISELDDKYFKVDNLLNAHYKLIDWELENTPNNCLMNDNIHIFNLSKENVQLIKSLLLIEQIQQFFYNIEEVLEKC